MEPTDTIQDRENDSTTGLHSLLLRKILLIGLIPLPAFGIVLYLIRENVLYEYAQTFANKVASVYPLNLALIQSITLVIFAFFLGFSLLLFSKSKTRRLIGAFSALLFVGGFYFSLGIASLGFNFSPTLSTTLKCYVFSQGQVKLYPINDGVDWITDPVTGKKCEAVTPDIAEILADAQKGLFPKEIAVGSKQDFFDRATGEIKAWYFRNGDSRIELFDRDGFHPLTQSRLKRITKEIGEEWESQPVSGFQAKQLENVVDFFDHETGKPKVWFWLAPDGSYEFFDGPGFHPRTGQKYRLVTHQIVDEYKSNVEAAELELRKLDEIESARLKEEQNEIDYAKLVGEECDRLATDPYDQARNSSFVGTSQALLGDNPDAALSSCREAFEVMPSEARYKYQYARVLQTKEPERARPIFVELVSQRYAAAYANLGWLYFSQGQSGKQQAFELFSHGSELGDPEAMFGVWLMSRGGERAIQDRKRGAEMLVRAANIGHKEALADLKEVQAQSNANREMFNLVGGIIALGLKNRN